MGDVLRAHPELAPVFMDMGMHCLGCPSSQMESISDACAVHGLKEQEVLDKLNSFLNK